MKLVYLGELIFVYITAVACLLRLPSDSEVHFQDDIYIRLKEGARTRRSADDEQLHPETYDFDLSVNSTRLHVHLKRNDNIKTSVPTLGIKGGLIHEKTFQDNEESIFYQDIKNGAVFVVQENENRAKNLFGVFQAGGENYVVQTPGRNKTIKFGSNYNRFQIFKEKHKNITFNDSLRKRLMKTKIRRGLHDRRKRAAGPYQVELLIVVDYSVYQYWYNKSTKTTALERETDALSTVRQFYAFVINGMDAMYKSIQTSAYTISIVFAGIIIAQTSSDSSFTETIVVKSVEPNQVDASAGLANFKTWAQSQTNLPGHDHAMLFTRYDLTYGGSTGIAGLAYLSAVCTSFGQSIVEDHFNFILLTVASHELGHSLSSAHDGDGNTCNLSDAYIMASSSSPQTGSTATNPWKFSSCSTNYFTKYIDSLESSGSNCLKSLSSIYNSSALAQYTDKPGQVYDANAQCVNIQGPGSFFCSSFYNGNLSTICTLMWCANPSKPGYCFSAVAADGTLCGDQKWCVTGVCVNYFTSSTTSRPTTATSTTKATPTQTTIITTTTTSAGTTTLPTTTNPTTTPPSTTKQPTTPPTTTTSTPTTTKVTTPPTTTKATTTPPTTTKQTTTPPTTTKQTTTPPTTTKQTTTTITTIKPTTPLTTTKPTTTSTTTKSTTTTPTTTRPTTTPPITTRPTTPPTTTRPTTTIPTITTPTTTRPTTTTPTTTRPTTTPPTTTRSTITPPTTTRPTTTTPTTTIPTTTTPTTTRPTTTTPTTTRPTTTPPTTTRSTTTPPTTTRATTRIPTTTIPTATTPTTTRPTTTQTTTTKPTTTTLTTTRPTTTPPATTRPTTTPPTTTRPTTTPPTTTRPTTTTPTTTIPTTTPTTTRPTTTTPNTTKPTTTKPTTPTTTPTTTTKSTTTTPTTTRPTTTTPTTTKPTTTFPSTTKPSTTQLTTIKPTNATITQTTTKKRSTTKRRRPRNRKKTTKQTTTRTSTTTSP